MTFTRGFTKIATSDHERAHEAFQEGRSRLDRHGLPSMLHPFKRAQAKQDKAELEAYFASSAEDQRKKRHAHIAGLKPKGYVPTGNSEKL